MKIALLSWESAHSIYIGGVASHVTELACALERKGHETHVFTRMAHDGHALHEVIDGVHYHRCPYPSHSDFIDDIDNMCRAMVDTVFRTEDYMGAGFDIVHAHDWLTANAMIWIKQGRGRKTIFTIHSTEYGRCGNNFYKGNSDRIHKIERDATYYADRVIAVSKALKNETMWIYNTPDWKIDSVYNGISYHNFDGYIDPNQIRGRYGIGAMDPMVLFAGRMVTQKGPDILAAAIPNILHYYNNAKFVYAGDGGMRREVEEQVNRLGVGHAVRFVGHQGGAALQDLFKACDVVCVPSRNEPFGIVILEAWSAGKPVVASINGGPSEIVWHDINGYKIHANPESVAWGLGTLFCDFNHARWMGKNGRLAVETVFSWDVIADEVLSIYST